MVDNLSILDLLRGSVPVEVVPVFNLTLVLLRTAGVLAIFYFLLLVAQGILMVRRSIKIRKIESEVIEINQKVDKLLTFHKKKDKIHSKTIKKARK